MRICVSTRAQYENVVATIMHTSFNLLGPWIETAYTYIYNQFMNCQIATFQ